MKKRIEIVKADSVDDAHKVVPWATMFQRAEDWRVSNNWICSKFIN